MKLQFPVLALLMAFTFSACQKELSYEVDPGNTAGVGGGGGGNGGGGSSGGYYIKEKRMARRLHFPPMPWLLL